MAKKKFIPNKLIPWVEARKRHRLSHAQVQMARELGMNPKNLGKLDNHKQESRKTPLPEYIEELYERQFGKLLPDSTPSIEEKKEARRKRKEEKSNQKRVAGTDR